jgi:putative transposase
MARIARIVVPGYPHHVTQRGNRRQQAFFYDGAYQAYIDLMSHWCRQHAVDIWGYCLMPNHVHLIAVPSDAQGLRLAIGEAHRRYTRRVNFRQGWRGHLWQGRFCSCVMQQTHLLACARYIEMNPVRANLVQAPERWLWSSATAHISGRKDDLVECRALLEMVHADWKAFLMKAVDKDTVEIFRKQERTGRPIGDNDFIEKLEKITGRHLKPRKPGPKPKAVN